MCKVVRGLKRLISSPVVQHKEDESWKRSTRVQLGEYCISIHQLDMLTAKYESEPIPTLTFIVQNASAANASCCSTVS
jgi:hypothetical protein